MKQEFSETIKKRLNELKEEYGTQQAFADAIGVTRNAVTPWLSGKKIPSASVIELICRNCNVSPNWLFGIDESIPLSYAAQESVRDCGSSLLDESLNVDYNGNPYTDTNYQELREIHDDLLQEPEYYRALRMIYDSVQFAEERERISRERRPGKLDIQDQAELMIEAAGRRFKNAADTVIRRRTANKTMF